MLCIGAGTRFAVALYLAAAGVGTIGIVDFDVVDSSNLQRQVLFTTDDVGEPKVECAAKRIQAMNPFIDVRQFNTKLTSANAIEIFRDSTSSPMEPITSLRVIL